MGNLAIDPPAVLAGQYNIQGNLVLDNGLQAAGIPTLLYGIGFGGKDTRLGETKSDAQGKYSITYAVPAGMAPNLQVRGLDPAGKEVTVSKTKFRARPSETTNPGGSSPIAPLGADFQRT